MSQIVLDFGSGNTCKNNTNYVKRMIDELAAVDTGKHEICIKWQLFKKAGDNIPLEKHVFNYAYEYAKKYGYKTTASVFDKESLDFLLEFDVPFIKIANRRDLDGLIGEVPRKIPIHVSIGGREYDGINKENPWPSAPKISQINSNLKYMCCVSKYPANIKDYEERFDLDREMRIGAQGISDHTIGLQFFKKMFSYQVKPAIWEKHYKLSDSTGFDAGDFAITPEELKGVL